MSIESQSKRETNESIVSLLMVTDALYTRETDANKGRVGSYVGSWRRRSRETATTVSTSWDYKDGKVGIIH